MDALIAAPATRIMAAYAERRRINRAIAELAALSDHVLADIGVARHDIERIVRYGRDATEFARERQGHFTAGGSDERIDSTLPPVLRPNVVPRS